MWVVLLVSVPSQAVYCCEKKASIWVAGVIFWRAYFAALCKSQGLFCVLCDSGVHIHDDVGRTAVALR